MMFLKSDYKTIYSGRSKYRKLTIVDDLRNHKRIMFAGNRLFVAGIDIQTGFPIDAPYFLVDMIVTKPKKLLFIGGGPNAVPAFVWRRDRPEHIDVVERDPLTTTLAKHYFNLPSERGYQVYHVDVKDYIKKVRKKYDIVYSNIGLTRRRGLSKKDLYDFCNFPGIKKLANLVSQNGALVYIIVAKLQGKDLAFVHKLFVIFKKVFKTVYVFSDFQDKKSKTQTIVLLATKRKVDIIESYNRLREGHELPRNSEIYERLISKIHKKGV